MFRRFLGLVCAFQLSLPDHSYYTAHSVGTELHQNQSSNIHKFLSGHKYGCGGETGDKSLVVFITVKWKCSKCANYPPHTRACGA